VYYYIKNAVICRALAKIAQLTALYSGIRASVTCYLMELEQEKNQFQRDLLKARRNGVAQLLYCSCKDAENVSKINMKTSIDVFPKAQDLKQGRCNPFIRLTNSAILSAVIELQNWQYIYF
jgi:hypothetical protein